jgi:hypothetical protein
MNPNRFLALALFAWLAAAPAGEARAPELSLQKKLLSAQQMQFLFFKKWLT